MKGGEYLSKGVGKIHRKTAKNSAITTLDLIYKDIIHE